MTNDRDKNEKAMSEAELSNILNVARVTGLAMATELGWPPDDLSRKLVELDVPRLVAEIRRLWNESEVLIKHRIAIVAERDALASELSDCGRKLAELVDGTYIR